MMPSEAWESNMSSLHIRSYSLPPIVYMLDHSYSMDPSQPFIGRYFSPTSTVIKSYLRTLDA